MLTIAAGMEVAAGAAAADTGRAAPEQVRARLYVANGDQNGLANILDGRGNPINSFRTIFGEGAVIAAGNVVGDAAEELVVVDGNGFVVPYDVATGKSLNGPAFKSSYDTTGETIAVGDVNNDGIDELLVANDDNTGVIEIFDVRAKAKLPGFGVPDTTFEDEPGNGFAVGDVDADGRVEALVANKAHGGRIDVLDTDTGESEVGYGVPDTTFEDDRDSEFAVGDVDRDGKAEVLVANAGDGEGRIDVLDTDTGEVKTGFGVEDSTFDNSDENQFKVADVDGDRKVEALVANGDGPLADKGRIDVLDPAKNGPEEGFGVHQSGFGVPDMFAVSAPADSDLDSDGIPDRVELNGIRAADGSMLLNLPDLGASPCRKDIVVEIDYMVDASGNSDDHDHKPREEVSADGTVRYPALEDAREVMAAGDVDPVADCPYDDVSTESGINLISIVDQAIPEELDVSLESRFVALKRDYFRAELDPYVHWSLWLHNYTEEGNPVAADGRASPAEGPTEADYDDQDFLLTDTGGTHSPGNRTAQALTYLHELGHVIGLRHGGDENVNCKPNYLSIMNYTFANTGLVDVNNKRLLGFSESKLGPAGGLDEKHLDETAGLAGDHPKRLTTMWSDAKGNTKTGAADGPLDWNGDGDGGADEDVPVNINVGLTDANSGAVDCDPDNEEAKPVTGFDDWAALNEDLEPVPFAKGDDGGNVEPTPTEVATLQQLWDQALNPQQSTLLAPPLAGFTSPIMGMAIDGDNVYTTHHYRSTSTPPASGPPGTLMVADRKTMAVKANIPLGFGPRAVAVNPVNHRVYAISGSPSGDTTRSQLTVVDGTTLAVVGKTELITAQATADIAVSSRTNRVYVSNPSQNRIHVVDGITGAELEPILVGPGPVGMAVDESRNTLYVAMTKRQPNQPQVAALGRVVDDGVAKPQILPLVNLGDPSLQPVDVAVDPAGGRVYVGGLGGGSGEKPSVTVLDQATGQQVARINTRGPVRAVALNPDNGLVFAVGDRGVDVIDAAQLKVIRIIDSGLSFSAGTGTGASRDLYVGDFATGTLTRLPYSSGQPL